MGVTEVSKNLGGIGERFLGMRNNWVEDLAVGKYEVFI